jgi:hypothetical protein
VPRLPANGVIDIQITGTDDESLEPVAAALAVAGWCRRLGFDRDHQVLGCRRHPRNGARLSSWSRRVSGERTFTSDCNDARTRYAVLVGDSLRTRWEVAEAYAQVK